MLVLCRVCVDPLTPNLTSININFLRSIRIRITSSWSILFDGRKNKTQNSGHATTKPRHPIYYIFLYIGCDSTHISQQKKNRKICCGSHDERKLFSDLPKIIGRNRWMAHEFVQFQFHFITAKQNYFTFDSSCGNELNERTNEVSLKLSFEQILEFLYFILLLHSIFGLKRRCLHWFRFGIVNRSFAMCVFFFVLFVWSSPATPKKKPPQLIKTNKNNKKKRKKRKNTEMLLWHANETPSTMIKWTSVWVRALHTKGRRLLETEPHEKVKPFGSIECWTQMNNNYEKRVKKKFINSFKGKNAHKQDAERTHLRSGFFFLHISVFASFLNEICSLPCTVADV